MSIVHIQTSDRKHRSLRTERLTEFTKCHLHFRVHIHSITTSRTEQVSNPRYQVRAMSAVVQPARVQYPLFCADGPYIAQETIDSAQ